MRDRRLLPLFAAILFSGASLGFADQVVYFVNGKAILVKSLEKGEKFTVLEMEGGGRIGVPTDQIVRIEDYVVSAPAVAQAAPQQTTPVAPAQTGGGNGAVQPAIATGAAQTGNPPGPQPAMSTVPGPGVGGRPAGGLNGGLATVQPLDIGGVGSPATLQRPFARPGIGGPGGPAMVGPGVGRPNLAAGRRLAGRGPLFGGGRGGRGPARLDEPATPPAPGAPSASQGAQPAQPTQPPVAQAPSPNNPPEEPPAPPPDDSNEEPSDPSTPPEGDTSGDTPGSAS